MPEALDEFVQVKRSEYEQLLKDQQVLAALEAAGVDNWDWYDDALQPLRDSGLFD